MKRKTAGSYRARTGRRSPLGAAVLCLLAVAALFLLLNRIELPAGKDPAPESGLSGETGQPNVSGIPEEPEEPAVSYAATEEEAYEKLLELQERFPDGMYWNHMGMELEDGRESWDIVTDIPCEHWEYDDEYCNRYNGATKELFPEFDYLTQCLGFSSMISDLVFGEDAPVREYYGFDNIRVGDQIRFLESWHSMIVLEKGEDYVLVGEVDEDQVSCRISWGRYIGRREFRRHRREMLLLTRYEDDPEEEE